MYLLKKKRFTNKTKKGLSQLPGDKRFILLLKHVIQVEISYMYNIFFLLLFIYLFPLIIPKILPMGGLPLLRQGEHLSPTYVPAVFRTRNLLIAK